MNNLYSIEEAAKELGATKHTVLNLASEGLLVLQYRMPSIYEMDISTGKGEFSRRITPISPAQAGILMTRGKLDISEAVNIYVTSEGTIETQYQSITDNPLNELTIDIDAFFIEEASINDYKESQNIDVKSNIQKQREIAFEDWLKKQKETPKQSGLSKPQVWSKLCEEYSEHFRPLSDSAVDKFFKHQRLYSFVTGEAKK